MDILRKTLDYVDNALEDAVVTNRQAGDERTCNEPTIQSQSAEALGVSQQHEELNTNPPQSIQSNDAPKTSFWTGVLPSKIVSRGAGTAKPLESLNSDELRKELDKALALNSQLKKRIAVLEKENREIFEEGLKFSTEAGQQESKVTFLRQKLNEAERVISKCNQRIEELTENNAILNETVAQFNLDNVAQSESELKELRNSCDTYMHKIELLDKELNQKTKEIECLKIEVEAGDMLRHRCQVLESEVTDLKSTKESLKRELHNYTQREDSMSYKQLEANRKLQQLESEILALRQQLEDSQGESTDQTALILLHNELGEYKERLRDEETQSMKLRKELQHLGEQMRKMTESKDKELQELETKITAIHTQRLKEEKDKYEKILQEKVDKIAALQRQLQEQLQTHTDEVRRNSQSDAQVISKTPDFRGVGMASAKPPSSLPKSSRGSEQADHQDGKASRKGSNASNDTRRLLKVETYRSISAFDDFRNAEIDPIFSNPVSDRVKDEAYFRRVIDILKHDLESERREKQAYRDECLRLSDEIELARSTQSVQAMQQAMSH